MEKKTLLIYVSGGVVQHVTTDDMNIRVLMADGSWMEAADDAPAHPIADFEMLNRGKEALAATIAGINKDFEAEFIERARRKQEQYEAKHPLCMICEQRIVDAEWIMDADGNARHGIPCGKKMEVAR